MKLTEPNPDTTQDLFYTAINALKIAGLEALAESLEDRMEQVAYNPKIAIYVEGGIVQGIRSNLGVDLDVEIVDADNEPDEAEDRWEQLETELKFGNY